jgi:hypothetical protein
MEHTLMYFAVVGLMVGLSHWASLRRRPPPPDDPRWRERPGPQIAGVACIECGRKIITSNLGVACHCGEVAHRQTCADQHRAHAHRPKREGDSDDAYR